MPVRKVTKNGKTGYQWGKHGKVYPTKEGAEKQARAAYANGYAGDTGNRIGFEYEIEPEGKSVREDAEFGRIKIKKFRLSKEDVNEYKGKELTQCEELKLDPEKIYRLYRPLSELRKAAPTFEMVPITVEHPEKLDTPFSEQQREGSTGSDAKIEGKYLVNSGKLWGLDAIHGLDTNTRREVSIFSKFDVDMTSGEFEGKPYDGIIRNIVGNSVALTISGRAGGDVAVGDSNKVMKMERELKDVLKRHGVRDSDMEELHEELMDLIKSNKSEHDTIEHDLDDIKRGERDSDRGECDSDDGDYDSDDDKIDRLKRKRDRDLDDDDSEIDDYRERRRGERDSDRRRGERDSDREGRRGERDSDREERRDDRREDNKRRRERDRDDEDERKEYRKEKRERRRDDEDSRRDDRRESRRGTGDSIEMIAREAEIRGAQRAQQEIAATLEAMKLAERGYGQTNFGVGDSAMSIYKTILRAEGIPLKGMGFEAMKTFAEHIVNNKSTGNIVGDSRMSDINDLLPSKFRGKK